MPESLSHEDARLPGPLRLVNWVANGAARLGLEGRPLSAEPIIERVTRSTGLTDFGEGDVREPLSVLLDSLEREAGLTYLGKRAAQETIHLALTKRLRIVDHLKRHPEIKAERIRRPIFVLGLPRTGTTLLFNLLALDPAARPLLGWESFQPLPPAESRPGRPDPRIAEYARRLRGLNYVAPYLNKLHPMTVEGPEECFFLLMRTLVTDFFGLQYRIPGYLEWLHSRPRSVHESAYRLHKDQLRILQSQNRGGHWLLKCPAHLAAIEAIAAVYPDALFVQTHRDLTKVFPSACSLVAVARRACSDDVEPETLGRDGLAALERTLSRVLQARETLPAERIVDVRYAEFVREPLATVRRIYEHFGLTTPENMEPRVEDWLAANPKNKFGAHSYSLQAFGTDRATLYEKSAAYRERFEIPRED